MVSRVIVVSFTSPRWSLTFSRLVAAKRAVAIIHGMPSSRTTVVVRGRPNPLQAVGRDAGLKLIKIKRSDSSVERTVPAPFSSVGSAISSCAPSDTRSRCSTQRSPES
jgi:hypothetical protein